MMDMRGQPMITQAYRGSAAIPKFDPTCHVLVEYPSEAPRPGTIETSPLINPKGMSGSLLWDTKFVASGADCNEWSADMSRVCGLLWDAHPSEHGDVDEPKVLSAIKIEHVVEAITRILGST